MTEPEIIIKKRKLQPNEFDYSPINTFSYRALKELFDYIEQNSNLKIIDISNQIVAHSRICFRVVDKNSEVAPVPIPVDSEGKRIEL